MKLVISCSAISQDQTRGPSNIYTLFDPTVIHHSLLNEDTGFITADLKA
jgi:hypothetical protein